MGDSRGGGVTSLCENDVVLCRNYHSLYDQLICNHWH